MKSNDLANMFGPCIFIQNVLAHYSIAIINEAALRNPEIAGDEKAFSTNPNLKIDINMILQPIIKVIDYIPLTNNGDPISSSGNANCTALEIIRKLEVIGPTEICLDVPKNA